MFETWFVVDKSDPKQTRKISTVFSQDNMANRIGVRVVDNGAPVTLTGDVMGYAIRSDDYTVIMNGTKEGNAAYIDLPSPAYYREGLLQITIKLEGEAVTETLLSCTATVQKTQTGQYVDPGTVIPNLEQMLQQIVDATEAANEAAEKLDDLDAAATQLAPSAAPTAELSTVDGHYRITFGIPKGEKGDTGATGAQGPQGEKGDTGDTGPQGEKGDTGATGAQGPKGDTGATGAQGPKGDAGASGAQGPQGPKGETGDPAPVAEVSNAVNTWLNTYVSPVGSAVVVDRSLSVAGAAADAKITGEYKSALYGDLYRAVVFSASDFQQGAWGAANGTYNSSLSNAICAKNDINIDAYIIECTSAYKMQIQAWADTRQYQGVWNGSAFVKSDPQYYCTSFDLKTLSVLYPIYWFKITAFRADGTSNIAPSEAVNFKLLFPLEKNILTPYAFWRNGTPSNVGNANGITTPNIMPTYGAKSVSLVVNVPLETGYKYRATITTYTVDNGKTNANVNKRITADAEIITTGKILTFDLRDGCIGFALALFIKNSSDAYGTLRVDSFDTSQLYVIRNYEIAPNNYNDYAVLSDFRRIPVALRQLGTLSALQAFCKYNDKYYSTDGEKLYVQNASFTQESATTLNLGHGNSIQLGHNGKAFVSGWDDQNVYEVDLSTKTIIATYTLPTTGYTTAAVDDVNKLMYIFQRGTTPSTEENYNFIVYDYANNEILSTKKTTVSFGAMQDVDFIDGKIFVLNGLGTAAVPNGYRIYNTNGDVISEYVLGTFAADEPEGVCVDRDTGEVLISFFNKKIYKIEQ